MQPPRLGNLLAAATAKPGTERFEVLYASEGARVERIVSSGSQPPASFDQDHDEWVMLVRGEAVVEVGGVEVDLQAGDHLTLPAHTPHTVVSTSQGAVWLAVHAPACLPSPVARP